MECYICGGILQHNEEVMGTYTTDISEDGTVDFEGKEFFGESWTSVACGRCGETYESEWDRKTGKLIVDRGN